MTGDRSTFAEQLHALADQLDGIDRRHWHEMTVAEVCEQFRAMPPARAVPMTDAETAEALAWFELGDWVQGV